MLISNLGRAVARGHIRDWKTGFQGQVRWIWLYRKTRPWNAGIVEYWNIGFGGMRSKFYHMALTTE
ncbi:hypothetical protein D1AOALGA4SA_11323 [Olavius algarvensis Delta 1 endosymbiont]|nr:hypothetical protein D1AOALGA4SA_11323 [Olavius algarvensis Delta 1 endosymbiont]